MSFGKILVALDDSDLSKEVFRRAIELAKVSNSSLILVSCISSDLLAQPLNMPTDVGLYPDLMSSNYPEQQIAIDLQVERVKTLLHGYQEEAEKQGFKPETEFKIGDVGAFICDMAKDYGADLIVVGRRGRSGISEALMGSISNHVVHHAPCSVLVIQ